jgi:hypothetical protein
MEALTLFYTKAWLGMNNIYFDLNHVWQRYQAEARNFCYHQYLSSH